MASDSKSNQSTDDDAPFNPTHEVDQREDSDRAQEEFASILQQYETDADRNGWLIVMWYLIQVTYPTQVPIILCTLVNLTIT